MEETTPTPVPKLAVPIPVPIKSAEAPAEKKVESVAPVAPIEKKPEPSVPVVPAPKPVEKKPAPKKEESKKEAEQKKEKPLVVRATGDFTVSLNGCVRKYKAGQLEGDYITAKFLLETNCPVVDIEDANEYVQCPCCKHIFTPVRG